MNYLEFLINNLLYLTWIMELVFILLTVLVVAFIDSIVGLDGAIMYLPLFYWLGLFGIILLVIIAKIIYCLI